MHNIFERLFMWDEDVELEEIDLSKADFEESEHPRDKDGKFTDKNGSQFGGASANGLEVPDNIESIVNERRGKNNVRLGKTLCQKLGLQLEPDVDGDFKAIRKAGEDKRKEVKINLVNNIAQRAGVDKMHVAAIVKQWSETSNDDSPRALNIQKVLCDVFNLELSDWQKRKFRNFEFAKEAENPKIKEDRKMQYAKIIKDYAQSVLDYAKTYPAKDARDEFQNIFNSIDNVKDFQFPDDDPYCKSNPGAIEGLKSETKSASDFIDDISIILYSGGLRANLDETLKPVFEELNEQIDNYTYAPSWEERHPFDDDITKKVVTAMYNYTQETFKDWGFSPDDEIELYRGIRETTRTYVKGEKIELHGNPIESWSLSPTVANSFGTIMLATKIKVRNVFCLFNTGVGCMPELEIVILNGLKTESLVVNVDEDRW